MSRGLSINDVDNTVRFLILSMRDLNLDVGVDRELLEKSLPIKYRIEYTCATFESIAIIVTYRHP
jgi:hypothetical protein